jgi:DNA-binding NtrC family response regulator
MPEKILVIDDEPLILTAVERALSRTGYAVATARDLQGLATALDNAPYDLLITDIHMKEESVDTIIQEVRKTSPSVRIIYMSGAVNKDNYRNFIEKPFKIADLREKVRVILHEPS